MGIGIGSVIRIPIPGSNGLAIELKAINWKGSTSALFFQSADGKRALRLDYGWNTVTGKIDYHWNQKGTYDFFGIADHTPAGQVGEALYTGAKFFRYAGRVFLVAGAVADAYSIVVAKERWRQVARVASGWTGAWAGAEALGASFAEIGGGIGTAIEPVGGTAVGTAIGGLIGTIVGGVGGYNASSWATTKVYDWVKETYFEPLPEVPAPRR
ncbi:MAG TPA: hypothetical protein VMW75_23750 [Thermoanaerobaculia bacterium]|nr:hypothetical protein [Thermoanaerobaculia bacterium]